MCAFSGPRAPDEPRVDGGENGIKISLTATTNQFGPIRYLHLASCATTMHNSCIIITVVLHFIYHTWLQVESRAKIST